MLLYNPIQPRRILGLSGYHGVTLTGGGDLLVTQRGVRGSHCSGGTTFAGFLPRFSTANACVRFDRSVSLLDGDRRTNLNGLNDAFRRKLARAVAPVVRRVTRAGPRLTTSVRRTLRRNKNKVSTLLGRLKRRLISTLHASAHGI